MIPSKMRRPSRSESSIKSPAAGEEVPALMSSSSDHKNGFLGAPRSLWPVEDTTLLLYHKPLTQGLARCKLDEVGLEPPPEY
ncbi:hypothetical protein AVEN_214616-1 [Araneus ventricosus]|uniref:Uncharacterized protein n=1 Tax=Araneus ventricosus TaxID=182803 RepID=A0A4Y2GMT5_ARAVE|nr:hypothetical protein AVEN_214616-1 [Araneus ventricosus]